MTQECFSCHVRTDKTLAGFLVWVDDLVVVNHYVDLSGSDARAGWLVVSPVRHVTRLFHLSAGERDRVFLVSAALNRVLADVFGSRRTLVASLGWFVDDHVHVHVVPTFGKEVTYGFMHFADAGAYQPVPVPVSEVVSAVRSRLADQLGSLSAS